ncbi:cyclic nucleotide-binding domain-containing protein [Streptomyces sp. NBC_01481]|uniref:cyclic nucleotide-binding domain-containing protein n=1 Tax=Streptomyces sp. NBC_01481 TaxID=2975869 RepID=UPI00224DB24A|nr:cyclic nucleotide-binding domain-containing protein [Streptomyces sp. NBC_01481]MCX4585641.1 cyclic nucleotide-binding domain-containing protein [Streptomyces sp. NBC_01481]
MTTMSTLLNVLPPEGRDRLMELAEEKEFPAGARIFEEGGRADHFWIIRSGTVDLDLHVPGRRAAVVEHLGPGDLLGWSWLFPPRNWHLGARAATPVRAMEFDAVSVRTLCDEDPEFDRVLTHRVAEVIAHRLQSARGRLLDLYGPSGGEDARQDD